MSETGLFLPVDIWKYTLIPDYTRMAKNRTRIQYSSETYFHPLKETAKHSTGLERFIVLINLQLFWFSAEQQKTKDKRTRVAKGVLFKSYPVLD